MTSALQVQAVQQGIDATLATKLIDRDEIVFDENCTPTNSTELLKALIKTYPNLVTKQPAPTSGGATNPSRAATGAPKELSWETIVELQKDPAEYNRRNADGSISRWLHAHPYRYGGGLR